jgi:uncharacterized cofD-like protein
VSESKMNLAIRLKNGEQVLGENHLDHNAQVRKIGVDRVFLKPRVKAGKSALRAIRNADMIVIGPGDFYGSIVPNFLADGLTEEIYRSSATVVYNCNLTNKKGQTDKFNVYDYVDAVNSYFKKSRIDYVIVPTLRPSPELIARYEKKEGKGSIVDFGNFDNEERDYKIVRAAVLKKAGSSEKGRAVNAGSSSFIRHDSDRLAKAIIELIELEDGKMIKSIH